MTKLSKEQIRETVKNFIVEELKREKKATDISDEQSILTSGMLDSLFLVDLLLFIEENFNGIKINLETVSRTEIDTINGITDLVYSKTN